MLKRVLTYLNKKKKKKKKVSYADRPLSTMYKTTAKNHGYSVLKQKNYSTVMRHINRSVESLILPFTFGSSISLEFLNL